MTADRTAMGGATQVNESRILFLLACWRQSRRRGHPQNEEVLSIVVMTTLQGRQGVQTGM
jgi:hypothetical protein